MALPPYFANTTLIPNLNRRNVQSEVSECRGTDFDYLTGVNSGLFSLVFVFDNHNPRASRSGELPHPSQQDCLA
jgi:hypothetical protein